MNSTQPQVGSYRWVVITLWMLTQTTGWVIVLGIGILLPSITEEFGLSYAMQGLLASGPVWANTILYLPLSIWLGRYSPKLLTTVTLLIALLLVFLQASTSFFVVFLLFRLLFGITIAAKEPARTLLMHQWFLPREFLFVNALTAGILSFGLFGSILATPYILNFFNNDWRPTLYVFGGIIGALTVLWVTFGRERETPEFLSQTTGVLKPDWKRVLSHKALWLGGFGLLGVNASGSVFMTFYPTLMLERFQFPLESSALIISVNWVVCGIIGFIIGKISTDWNTRSRILYACGLILPLSYALLISTDSLAFLLVISTINGVGWCFFPILLTVSFHLPGIRIREVPIGHAFMFTNVSLGLALGPLVAGLGIEHLGNPLMIFTLMSLASFSVFGSAIFVKNLREFEIA